ncbi:MAG: FkbM family methyltransferase [Clostridia bacterium]|jgi:FkbM family methyltransferase
MKFYSQHKQDEFIIDYFKSKKNGIFLDIGAHDGITLSNTYTLETEFGWTGLCFEPMPHEFEKLHENRKYSVNYNCAIYDTEGIEKFTLLEYDGYPDMLSGIAKDISIKHMGHILSEGGRMGAKRKIIEVQTRILNPILVQNSLYEIDYLSLDTEGSELKILKSINYDKFKIKVITSENGEGESETRQFMKTKGFTFFKRLGIDDVFVNTKI